MQILECWLKHYGRFTDYRITFHPGLNVIEGGNESGKTTVFSFIRSMLYGIQKNRAKGFDEYQLRQPWEDPDHFTGAMKVHEGRCIYRIERNFLKKDESLRVINETEGLEVEDPEAFLRQITGGLSEEDFVNTFFIRQAQAQTDAQLGADIRDYLVNVEQSGSLRTDVAKALELLRKKRRDLETEKKKAQDEVSARMEDNRREADYVTGEISRLKERLEEEESREEENQTQFVRRSAEQKEPENTPETAAQEPDADAGSAQETEEVQEETQLPPILPVLLLSAAVMAALCAFFAGGKILRTFLWIMGAAFAAAGLWCLIRTAGRRPLRSRSQKRLRKAERSVKRYSSLNRLLGFRDDSVDPELEKKKRKLDMERRKALQAEQAMSRSETAADVARIMKEKEKTEPSAVTQAQASGRTDVIAREIREKMQRKALLDQEFEKMSARRDQIRRGTLKTDAVDLAMERIRSLSSSIYRESGEQFSQRVSTLLSMLTGGRYTSISMDEKMEININTPDRLLKLPQVSFGTMNQIWLALRIAAGELLCGGADLPLLMDEPFAMYDEKRLRNALHFLAGYGHQILLFTCQDREKKIAGEVS